MLKMLILKDCFRYCIFWYFTIVNLTRVHIVESLKDTLNSSRTFPKRNSFVIYMQFQIKKSNNL
jgi:hypothetical protein